MVSKRSPRLLTEIHNNNNFIAPQAPAPPVDPAVLKSAIDALAAAIAALDGAKKAIAQESHQKEVVVKLLDQPAACAEANCKGDMIIFLSSGFSPKSKLKTITPPASESIRKIDPGAVSGQVVIALMKYPCAVSYEVRWAPVPAGGVVRRMDKHAHCEVVSVNDYFRSDSGNDLFGSGVAVTKAGYTDWSDSVTHIVV